MHSEYRIPTFIITNRSDGGANEIIEREFAGKNEFEINNIAAVVKNDGTIALLETVKSIVAEIIDSDIDYFLVCTDQHRFKSNYSIKILMQCIIEARELSADILCGDLGSLRSAMRVSKHLFWIEDFPGLPFTIVFRQYFTNILNAGHSLFSSSNRKFFMYPFIAVQNKPGYVRITSNEDELVRGNSSDTTADRQVKVLDNIITFYSEVAPEENNDIGEDAFVDMIIPTYVINLPERTERLDHIRKQFDGKDEFDVHIIEACKHSIGAVGLWESIRKIVNLAIANDDDVIIICEDDHVFTGDYSKSHLIKNIIGAYKQHTEVLLGGIGGFNKALPVSAGRAWVNDFYCTQFTVLYKSVFQKIFDEPYDNQVIADGMLSRITGNIMVCFPFISIQEYFGYSDVTQTFDADKGLLKRMFSRATDRLKKIYTAKAALQYHQH